MKSQMPFVKLNYGPYLAHGVIRHKIQRLRGIINCLTDLGYDIELVPSQHIDRLSVEMMQREVFRCNINNLCFNIDCENDVVAKRLVAALEEAKQRMYAHENIMLYNSINNGKREIQRIQYRTDFGALSTNIKLLFEISKGTYFDEEFIAYLLAMGGNQKGFLSSASNGG